MASLAVAYNDANIKAALKAHGMSSYSKVYYDIRYLHSVLEGSSTLYTVYKDPKKEKLIGTFVTDYMIG